MDTHRAEKWANGPVVVGTDGSEGAASAVRWAAREAAARDQPLRIVHAVDVDEADVGERARDIAQVMHDTPHRILNEAVELAKSFGGTDGFKFVNGVLDKLAADVRSVEVQAAQRR